MWKIASNRFQIVESVENNLFDKWTTVFAGHKAALKFRPRKMILSTYSPHRIISARHFGCLQTNTCGLCTISTHVYNVINGCICGEI